jgi:Uma2 family endonuclease
MTSEAQVLAQDAVRGPAWPPHDTEESVLGTDLHQTAITNLRLGLNEAAQSGLTSDQVAPWQTFSQTALIGCRRPEGSLYRTYPDVFVNRGPLDRQRGSTIIATDGPPLLIIEVLSEATYEVDIDLDRGKGWSYADAGVREYLTFDQTGRFGANKIRAWRLAGGRYQPWLPTADGRWHSATIGVAFALEDDDVIVYTGDGRRMLREGEIERERRRLQAELSVQQAEIEHLRRLLMERGE